MTQFDKVVSLIEKGYTKAEIDAMLMTPAEPAEPAAPAPDPVEPPAAPEPEPAEPAENEPQGPAVPVIPEGLQSFMDTTTKALQDLTAAVQASNIRTSSVDTTNVEDLNKILAGYINPPQNNTKE